MTNQGKTADTTQNTQDQLSLLLIQFLLSNVYEDFGAR